PFEQHGGGCTASPSASATRLRHAAWFGPSRRAGVDSRASPGVAGRVGGGGYSLMNAALSTREQLLAAIRQHIAEITPQQAAQRQLAGALLIDVREDSERLQGAATGAVGLSRGYLELRIEQIEPARERDIVLMCGSGTRSLLAADALARLGYRRVASITGG